MKRSFSYIIGIDEAGRGPLAGPVSVGVACISRDFNWDLLPGVNDSKKLSEKRREVIFKQAKVLKKEGKLAYAVAMVDAVTIDRIGIVPSVAKAMEKALQSLVKELKLEPEACAVKLDGSLKAPRAFIYQETIIGGDGKEKVIGLASIMAKVTRDRHMVSIAKKGAYIAYNFDIHKGYGTKAHREAIAQKGLSDIHRKSFCTKLISS